MYLFKSAARIKNVCACFFREEDATFSTPCETELGVIALPNSTNYDEMTVPPPAESPNFNADLENLFSTDQQGDVLSNNYFYDLFFENFYELCF